MVTELKELPRAESRSAGWRASSPAAFAISSISLNIRTPARSMVAKRSALPGNDRGHRFVTDYCAALGIDRHDPSAITGLTQQLHDGAARPDDAGGCQASRTGGEKRAAR